MCENYFLSHFIDESVNNHFDELHLVVYNFCNEGVHLLFHGPQIGVNDRAVRYHEVRKYLERVRHPHKDSGRSDTADCSRCGGDSDCRHHCNGIAGVRDQDLWHHRFGESNVP